MIFGEPHEIALKEELDKMTRLYETAKRTTLESFIAAGEKRTPGEWETSGDANVMCKGFGRTNHQYGCVTPCNGSYKQAKINATFIAASSRIDLAPFLEAFDKMAEALTLWEELLDEELGYTTDDFGVDGYAKYEKIQAILALAQPYLKGEK